jgi:hypothetical protein
MKLLHLRNEYVGEASDIYLDLATVQGVSGTLGGGSIVHSTAGNFAVIESPTAVAHLMLKPQSEESTPASRRLSV